MSRKITQDEFKDRVMKIYDNSYKILSPYINKRSKVSVQHKCGYTFDVVAGGFMYGKTKCPVCENNSTSLTTEAIKIRIQNKYGDEYELLSDYKGSTNTITVKHKTCGNTSNVLVSNFLRAKCGCVHCCQKGTTKNISQETKNMRKNNFLETVSVVNPTLEIIGDYIDSRTKIKVRCKDCNQEYYASPTTLRRGNGCMICNNHMPSGTKHIKCLNYTHPKIAELLVDKNFGETHTYGTHVKAEFICPRCNNVITTRPITLFNENTGWIRCNKCGDGISYPEKFVINVLDQLGISYIYQYSSKNAPWVDKYRYDFYLIDCNCILEINGEQHYLDRTPFGTNHNQKEIDKIKKQLALDNGIYDYIEIDASESSLDFIKNSIILTLSDKFDLSSIDWIECATYASSSLLIKVCDDWNNEINYIPNLADKYHVDKITIYSYLEKGNEYKLCNFNNEEYKKSIKEDWYKKIASKLGKKIKCIETGVIYNSLADAAKQFNGKGNSISRAATGQRKSAYGFHWEFI